MKVYVTGVNGQLGYDIVKLLNQNGIVNKGVDRKDVDITNKMAIQQSIREYQPDIVVHCAAYTAVDRAEEEAQICEDINVNGTRYIAEVCKEIDATMFYFSTDYVFNGSGEKPWTEEDQPNPLSVYGKTKLEGEQEVKKVLQKYFILRISWVFGKNGHNFIETMLKLAKTKKELSIVSDQVGTPTFTEDVAQTVLKMISSNQFGIYHCTNSGVCSWFDFACKIFQLNKIPMKLSPVSTKEYPTAAQRPLNSRLDKSKLIANGFGPLPTWENALERYLSEKSES